MYCGVYHGPDMHYKEHFSVEWSAIKKTVFVKGQRTTSPKSVVTLSEFPMTGKINS